MTPEETVDLMVAVAQLVSSVVILICILRLRGQLDARQAEADRLRAQNARLRAKVGVGGRAMAGEPR